MSGNITVVVRCRPLNSREIARGAKGLVRMEGNNTYLDPPEAANVSSGRVAEKEVKSFAFDKSYWSACPKDEPGYASQETVYNDLGKDLLDHSFEGFNTCIFAYGQTGSGKSYSMMGYGADRGIIPLICEALFERIESQTTDKLTFTVEVSYTEIYQEKVRDLLNPANKGNLKVREHPALGPYVEGLSKLAVQNFPEIEGLMDEGMKARTVAATNMNETSSRSHAVFTILLTQRRQDDATGMAGEKVSRISLVDLAGSERANATGATGTRLKEGALINKSLTTLGRVIAALAQASGGGKAGKAAAEKVPYRDSVLTWLLKDSLGGNSKTAMVAAISPADYEETLSTLRYADQAKKIKNKAVVNEDPNAKLIRELKEELATLRTRMTGANLASEAVYDADIPAEKQIVQYKTQSGEIKTITKAELQDQLEMSEKLMASVTETWEEKLVRTQEVQKEREQALEALGITIEKNLVGVHTPKKMPHLVNLNEDPLMTECLIYQIKPGKTTVGNLSSAPPSDIRLSGSNILDEHCFFESSPDGKVTLHALPGSTTMVNGQRIPVAKPKELRSGFRIILGDFHVFRFNHPEEVRKARDTGALRSPLVNEIEEAREAGTSSPATRPESPMSTAEVADWSYARKEAVIARLGGNAVDLGKLKDEDLDKLYSDILRVRHSRTASSVASTDRPESRMSYMDSVEEDDDDDDSAGSHPNRHFSGSTWSTGPTSVGESTLTLSQPPEVEERLQAVKEEYEERIQAMIESAAEVDEVKAEKVQMEQKLKTLENQMLAQKQRFEKRVKKLRKAPAGGADEDDFDTTPLTPEQELLARRVVNKWRQRRRVRMAEDALKQAVDLKEANVLSRELKKGVSFQFVVVEGEVPTSASETIAGLGDIEEVTDPALTNATKPCMGVKVLDRRNRAICTWSLAKLQQRLQQMRNLYQWIDKPEYSQHFSWEDPFYESPPLPGGFSFVGSALVSLAPLSRNLPSTNTLQLFSPYTADPIGSCRVRIKPISVSSPANPSAPSLGPAGSHPSISPFVEGSTLTFEVIVDRVDGITRAEFTAVHLQLHLSSFFGPSFIPTDQDVLSAETIELANSATSEIKLRETITVELTSSIQHFLSDGYAPIELFARVTPAHLDKIERWDELRDAATTSKITTDPLRGDPLSDVTRRPENELISEQRHDVMTSVEIRELGESGDYVAVPVVSSNSLDTGAFFLRQGLQRRIVINLSHNSGRGWAWKRISKVTLGNVRMLDARGRVHAATSAADVELRGMGTPRAVFGSDGTATLSFAAAWDSSMHESPHLNRPTTAGHRALVRLTFHVVADNCSSPVPFAMDIAATVQGRDARAPSKLFNMLSSTRLSTRLTNVFAVSLKPFMTRRPTDIWRLNTAETFVRGEEVLSNWKPRGLSLIRDYDELVKSKRKLADVEAAKAVVKAFELTLPSAAEEIGRDERLEAAIALWQKQFGSKEEISLERESAQGLLDLSPSPTPPVSAPSPPSPGLTGEATIIPRTDAYAKRGHLFMLRDPTSNQWKKYWVVLRRPYLHLYESSSETEEVNAINLATVRVEQSPEIEQMLDRKFAFAIFTHQNSYFLCTQNVRDMMDWIKSIDPSLA